MVVIQELQLHLLFFLLICLQLVAEADLDMGKTLQGTPEEKTVARVAVDIT
jgi:hypothetical protein